MIRVTDNGQPVGGAGVRYVQGSSILTVTTDSNGYAYVDINLNPSTYSVSCEYGGKSVSSKITVKSALANTDVKFKIGNIIYNAKTDGNGVASYSSSLDVGTYTVTAVNPSSGESKSFKLTINKVSPSISLGYAKSGTLVTLTATLTPSVTSGDVIFTIGGNHANFTRSISSGKATLKVNLTGEGTYKAYATLVGNSNFNSARSSEISIVVSSCFKRTQYRHFSS